MDKDIGRDEDMAISKDQKAAVQAGAPNHKEKVKRAIKEITAKHPKLLKKLAEQHRIMELLDTEDIFAIHETAIENFGGSFGFYTDLTTQDNFYNFK